MSSLYLPVGCGGLVSLMRCHAGHTDSRTACRRPGHQTGKHTTLQAEPHCNQTQTCDTSQKNTPSHSVSRSKGQRCQICMQRFVTTDDSVWVIEKPAMERVVDFWISVLLLFAKRKLSVVQVMLSSRQQVGWGWI